MQRFKFITYNVNGLGNPIKRSKVLAKLKREKVDIALLQETHLTELEHTKLKRFGFNEFSSSCKQGPRRGVTVLISNTLNFECTYEKKDTDGRFIFILGHLEGVLTTILSVYAPPGSVWKFYKHIFELIISEAQGLLICGGDFNIRLNSFLDTTRPHYSGETNITRNVKLMMAELGLIDIWRELNPTKRDFTFFSHPHSIYSRLDYFFMFQKDIGRVHSCSIGCMDISDHFPVYIFIQLDSEKKRTIWRLNTGILNQMRDQIRTDIKNYLEENDNGEVSTPILWDALKAVLRGKIIGYCSNLKKQNKENLDRLQIKLKKLEDIHKKTQNQRIKIELDKTKNELN